MTYRFYCQMQSLAHFDFSSWQQHVGPTNMSSLDGLKVYTARLVQQP